MPAFRYFELIDEDRDRFVFWEIAIDGPALELRHGEVGTAGKHEVEMCASAEHARVEYEARIAAHVADGYRECEDRRLDRRTRALEAAISEAPDDVAAYLVYADWIQTLGDPRGGLIVAQAAAADEPRRGTVPASAAAHRAAAYLAEHIHRFLGPLAEHTGYDGSLLDLQWRWGFLHAARLTARDLWTGQPERVLEQFLEHPSSRWLRTLEIDIVDRMGTVEDTWSIQPVVDALAAREHPHLQRLELGKVGEVRVASDDDPYGYIPTWHARLAKLWPAVPALRALVLRGDPGNLGDLALPALERLEITAGTLLREAASAIAYGDTPALTGLAIRYDWRSMFGSVRPPVEPIAELAPLFESSLIRRLDQLAITGLTGADALCRSLSGISRPSLRELDLSSNDISDAGAESLARAGFRLEILDVTSNRISPRGLADLEAIAALVIGERQTR